MKHVKALFAVLAVMVLFAGFSSNLFAEEAKQSPDNVSIDQVKAKILANIDARINILQDERACVDAAKSRDDLKKCRQTLREERKEMRKR
ncbi:MAG TPA: hypothetical protein VF790_02985 [Dissulfurispiraceae bacterium]